MLARKGLARLPRCDPRPKSRSQERFHHKGRPRGQSCGPTPPGCALMLPVIQKRQSFASCPLGPTTYTALAFLATAKPQDRQSERIPGEPSMNRAIPRPLGIEQLRLPETELLKSSFLRS